MSRIFYTVCELIHRDYESLIADIKTTGVGTVCDLFYNHLPSVIHRITGCLVEETRVLKQSTRSTRRLRWRSTGSRSKSSSSSCPRKREEEEEEAAAGWEGAWVAEVLTHQEEAGATSRRMRDGTRCPSPRTDPSTPPVLARSQR